MGNRVVYGQDPTLEGKQIDKEYDGEQFEKYIVSYDGTSNFLNSYQFRIENKHPYLVDIKYAGRNAIIQVNQKIPLVAHKSRNIKLLKDLNSIQSNNSFVILKSSLKAFKDIFQKHGLISIKDSMIGINSKNRVKIWLNHNFALNNPQSKPVSLQNLDIKNHERQMIHNIFDLISSKTGQDSLWSNLIYRKEYQNPQTFDQAIHLLDNYANQNRLQIGQQVNNIFNKQYYRKLEQKSREINGDSSPLVQWIDTQQNDQNNPNLQQISQTNTLTQNYNPNIPHSNNNNHFQTISYVNPTLNQLHYNKLSNPPNIILNQQVHPPVQYTVPQSMISKAPKIHFNKSSSNSTSHLPTNILFWHERANGVLGQGHEDTSRDGYLQNKMHKEQNRKQDNRMHRVGSGIPVEVVSHHQSNQIISATHLNTQNRNYQPNPIKSNIIQIPNILISHTTHPPNQITLDNTAANISSFKKQSFEEHSKHQLSRQMGKGVRQIERVRKSEGETWVENEKDSGKVQKQYEIQRQEMTSSQKNEKNQKLNHQTININHQINHNQSNQSNQINQINQSNKSNQNNQSNKSNKSNQNNQNNQINQNNLSNQPNKSSQPNQPDQSNQPTQSHHKNNRSRSTNPIQQLQNHQLNEGVMSEREQMMVKDGYEIRNTNEGLLKKPMNELSIKEVSSQKGFSNESEVDQKRESRQLINQKRGSRQVANQKRVTIQLIKQKRDTSQFINEANSADIQSFKNAVNSSLVDTKQIKHAKIDVEGEMSSGKGLKGERKLEKQRLTYRQMRKLLFEQLNT